MLQSLNVQLLPSVRPNGLPDDTIAIVIDMLRFTTTAITAIDHGARFIATAETIDGANLAAQHYNGSTLRPWLCGERHGHRIDGFDRGNSPREYVDSDVIDRGLVFTTTNGTLAIASVLRARSILLASLLNRTAVADAIINSEASHCTIVCAGTDGEIALEDTWVAGAIMERLISRVMLQPSQINDSAKIALATWQQLSAEAQSLSSTLPQYLEMKLAECRGARNLIDAGYQADLPFAAKLDRTAIVPICVTTTPFPEFRAKETESGLSPEA